MNFSNSKSSSFSSSITTDFLQNEKYRITLPVLINATATASSLISKDEYELLPPEYKPSAYDVICGRGKGSYNKPGNKKFRAIVRRHVPAYLAAPTKFDKSSVLIEIIEKVKAQDGGKAMFVSSKKGRWYEIPEEKTREKVGHCLRETIAALEEAPTKKQPKTMQPKLCSKTLDDILLERQNEFQLERQNDLLLEKRRSFVDRMLSAAASNQRSAIY